MTLTTAYAKMRCTGIGKKGLSKSKPSVAIGKLSTFFKQARRFSFPPPHRLPRVLGPLPCCRIRWLGAHRP
jgi:hypothetical protein